MVYQLYYWPTIQGRGEFVRLALEEAGAEYVDVARGENGVKELMAALDADDHPSYAPPFLKAGALTIGQVATILQYLGEHLHLAPRGETARIWTSQLQLTIADLVAEAHDTHHPVSGESYYEDQKPEAARRAEVFRTARMPKYLGYFEHVLKDGQWLTGERWTYADLSLYQLVSGLQFAFPRRMATLGPRFPKVMAVYERVRALPELQDYFASPRHLPFGEGIFRHYPELDGN